MDFKELTIKLNSLNTAIADLMKNSEYTDFDDLSGLTDYHEVINTPDNLQLFDEYRSILAKLEIINDTLNYLNRPIKAEGYLVKQSNGRYMLNGTELTSGYGIEYLCVDERYQDFDTDTCRAYWKASRIEHNGSNYYIVGCTEDIGAVKVRIRQ